MPDQAGPGLAASDKLTVGGVNAGACYFATVGQQSQHIDEAVAVAAKPGADHLGAVALGVQGLDGLGQRNGPVCGDRGALLGLGETGAPVRGRIGRHGRSAKRANDKDGCKQSADQHEDGL